MSLTVIVVVLGATEHFGIGAVSRDDEVKYQTGSLHQLGRDFGPDYIFSQNLLL